MPLGPDDYLIRRTMTDIGTVDVVPFSMPCPSVDSTTLTIAFWFWPMMAIAVVRGPVGRFTCSRGSWRVVSSLTADTLW